MLPLDLSDEALGLDLIEELGPGGGFLDTLHTAERFRSEMWFPKLLDRHFYQGWLDRGALTTEERCRQQRDELLASHTPEPMPPDQERAIDEVVAAARRELLG
jgi:trimethylamine--corrinoid protein Co-methyltransferase